MTDPYRPTRSRTLNERNDGRAEFLDRLARLGATSDEIAAVDAAWDVPAGPDDLTVDELRNLDDDSIRVELSLARAEDDRNRTESDDDLLALARAAARQVVPESTIPAIRTWVAGDPVRARAALDVERVRPKARTTLVAELESIADGAGT